MSSLKLSRDRLAYLYNKIVSDTKLFPDDIVLLMAYLPLYSLMTKQELLSKLASIIDSDEHIACGKVKTLTTHRRLKIGHPAKEYIFAKVIGKHTPIKYKGNSITLCSHIACILTTITTKDFLETTPTTPLQALIKCPPKIISAVLNSIVPDDLIDTVECNDIDTLDSLTEYKLGSGNLNSEFIIRSNTLNILGLEVDGSPKFYTFVNNNLQEIEATQIETLL